MSKLPTCLSFYSQEPNPSPPHSGDYHNFFTDSLKPFKNLRLCFWLKTHMDAHMHIRRQLWGSLSPSALWVPGINLRLCGLVAGAFTQ